MDALGAFQQRSSGAMPQAFPPKTKIVTNHLGFPMKKQLKRVLGTNPTNTFFDCEEFGGKITVAQYFLKSTCSNFTFSHLLIFIEQSIKSS